VLAERESGTFCDLREIEDASSRLARLFENLGIQPGDRIVIQVGKSLEAVMLYIACLRYGTIYLPLGMSLQRLEIQYILNDAAPSLIVCDPQKESLFADFANANNVGLRTLDIYGNGSLTEEAHYLPAKSQIFPSRLTDTACILYTSGTTGNPKGAMLTHGNLCSNVSARAEAWNIQSNDVILHAQNIAHISGINSLNLALFVPCKLLFAQYSVDEIIRLLPKATIFMASPGVYAELLSREDFTDTVCSNCRLFITTTAPPPEKVFDEFKVRTGKTLTDRYGMTETGINTSNRSGTERKGSCGLPLTGVELRIVDDAGTALAPNEQGHIEVRGPNVFRGYWNDQQKTRESFTGDGFFKTGDLGRLDQDGYLWIVGRAKDVVMNNGITVYPKEVEQYLASVPGVVESAVFGLPDPITGEYVVAAVKRSNPQLSQQDILRILRKNIAAYKLPQKIFFVEEFPRNETGKIRKNVLREVYARDK